MQAENDEDDFIEDEVEESLAEDFVCRVEEAQFAIAWAGKLYRELYGKGPPGSWSDAMDAMVQAANGIKADLAKEDGLTFPHA